MFRIMLALHLLFAIFTIGPMAHATMTAVRGVRHRDASAMQASARTTRIYSWASILTIVFGFGLMSSTSPFTHRAVAELSEPWVWLSLLLWVVAMVLALVVIAPALSTAGKGFAEKRPSTSPEPASFTGRVGASGGLVALIFVAIVFLMVYQPGG